MKRVFLLIGVGIVAILLGVGLILPALANYGRPGPVVNDALRFLLVGVLMVVAGSASIFCGIRKRRL
jgi:hypothetical protein